MNQLEASWPSQGRPLFVGDDPPIAPVEGNNWLAPDGRVYTWVVTNSGGEWVQLLGEQGEPGTAATIAVGSTTTGNAGTNASVTNVGTSGAAVLNFTIPRGDQGTAGAAGTAATIAVGTTTTGNPGTNASVANSGTSSAAVFDFTIPRGLQGPMGPKAATLTSPTASEKLPLFFTNAGLTVAQIRSVVAGTSPSATFSIRYGTDFSGTGTEVVTGGITCTNTTTGLSTVSFNNASIPADNFVWITTSAISGTVNTLHATLLFS